MKLLEVGNTRWKLADFIDDDVRFIGHGIGLQDLLMVLEQSATQQLMFASVASDETNHQLQQRLTQAGIDFIQVVTQAEFAGVQNAYADYQRLGVDRWLTLLAARSLTSSHCVIVDAGTAITLDILDKDGQHQGGWIAPGLHTMQDALVARSNRIKARYDAPRAELGQCTEDGLFLGCQAALRGFVEQAHQYVQANYREPVSWFFSGGGTEHLTLDYIHNAQLRPHLVLEGLAVVARQSK
ncbi:type III pantothenate kinase [Aliidiomarina soli]|uniref:Type III pantothenate kinase n=1 Tax=Aliidiomarina soli TaxID=1928574 RepID=A0A432WGH8_9GAMM|nr:type III pantothenate kinase [Aliidiomarina soli]RUO32912.1 pantothenate kinase [Aliidiomarina soli]